MVRFQRRACLEPSQILKTMPTSSKSLRDTSTPVQKDKLGPRRASDQPSMLATLPSDASALSDRRRKASLRASKEMRSNSLPQGFSGSTPDSPPSGQSPDAMDDAPRTKTGRISTAKKGKPVHKCPDCGKVHSQCCYACMSSCIDDHQVYTRNEHLKYATL